MESPTGYSNFINLAHEGREVPLSPFPYLNDVVSYPKSPSSPSVDSDGKAGPTEGPNCHQRCSSDTFLFEEKLFWLDDLLNEPDVLVQSSHRRSVSDSNALLIDANTFKRESSSSSSSDEENYTEILSVSKCLVPCKDSASKMKASTVIEKVKKEPEVAASSLPEEQKGEESSKQNLEESSKQNLEGSTEKAKGSQSKSSTSKVEAKRAKQQNAHRSRVRKLQYMAQLERTIEFLRAEGSKASAELEFLEQQNIIISMENRTLRQRLATLSQEQLIKQFEQEMLEREVVRLQHLYQVQVQQQMQLPQQPVKSRRNRTRDIASSSRCALNNPLVT